MGALIAFTWVYTSLVTGGLIDKRYKNQDAAGRLKEDITTGRAEVMTTEIEAFGKSHYRSRCRKSQRI